MEELRKKIEAVEKKQEELSRALDEKHEQLAGEIGEIKKQPPGKSRDHWDKLGTLTPLISGVLISGIGLYFTHTNNVTQHKIQEVQTIERLMPHLTGDESEKKMAIIAISTLTNPETAAKIAQLFPSKGTVQALKSIASQGNKDEQDVAKRALASSLKTMGADYANQASNQAGNQAAKSYYEEALQMQQDVYGADSTKTVDTLVRLGQLSEKQGQFDQAIGYYDRARKTMIANHHNKTSDFTRILHALSRSYRLAGKMTLANDFKQRASSLDKVLDSGKTRDKATVFDSDSKQAEKDLDEGTSVDDIQPIQDATSKQSEDKEKPPAVVEQDVDTRMFEPESKPNSKNSADSIFSN